MSVYDHEAALARVGGDADLLREIAGLFEMDCPQALEKLREAIDSGDTREAHRLAHGLKGSAANFGATPAVDAAFRIEQLARDGKLGEIDGLLETLERALDTLRSELKEV